MKVSMIYELTSSEHLYEAKEDRSFPGWRGYFDIHNPDANSDASLRLEQTWSRGGVYLFAAASPTKPNLGQRVKSFLNGKITKSPVFLWLQDIDSDIFTPDNAWFISTKTVAGKTTTTNSFNYVAGSQANLRIGIEIRIHFDCEQGHVQLYRFSGTEILDFFGKDKHGTHVLENRMFIPFGGISGGAFRLRFRTKDPDLYREQFDIGLRYFYGPTTAMESIHYPVFKPKEGTPREMELTVSLDPVDLTNRHFDHSTSDSLRTYIAFEPNSSTLPSFVRTQFGHPVSLSPVASWDSTLPYGNPNPDDAMLVMNEQPATHDGKTLYWVPQGQFRIQVPTADVWEGDSFQLLCGRSGAETLVCMPATSSLRYGGDLLCFLAGQCAYAPDFSVTAAAVSSMTASACVSSKLNDRYHTAWMSIKEGSGRPTSTEGEIRYLSQPDDESYFLPFGSRDVLEWYQPVVTKLAGKQVWAPFVPLAGLEDQLDHALELELKIISQARKEIMDLAAEAPNPSESTAVKVVTPKGLLLVENGGAWESLTLARGKPVESKETFGSELKFVQVKQDLRNALQTNQQFLVLSLANGLWDSFANEIGIAGWPFQINVNTSASPSDPFRNILICKFGGGTVLDKVGDVMKWTNPGRFNDKLRLVEQANWMKQYCEEAIKAVKQAHSTADEHSKEHPLTYFAQQIQDETWHGILMLQTDVELLALPDDLIGLCGGIQKPVIAHHLGIRTNCSGYNDQSELDMIGESSLFAYIDYADCEFEVKEPYFFHVSRLQALFKNGGIATFDSEMKLGVSVLFDSPAQVPLSVTGSVMDFTGSLQLHQDKRPSYVFFLKKPVELVITNPILTKVTLDKANFQTISSTDDTVNTRFSFSGMLTFGTLLGGDLFSFDALSFSNMGICMSFNKKGAVSLRSDNEFHFDATGIALDLSKSLKRGKSLMEGLPIRLNGFMAGVGKEALIQSGYVPIVEYDGQIEDKENWYGLQFLLDLGSLGELSASKIMMASVALCWTGQGDVYMGLAIPGLRADRRQFMLEDWIDTRFGSLHLTYKSADNQFVLSMKAVQQQWLGNDLDWSAALQLFKGDQSAIGWYGAFHN